jgi:bacillithiol biosynthesis cysteine-adding enzyme BshC
MKSHCISFRQIPHTTNLFLDYLEFAPSVRQFYSRSPYFLEWAKEESSRIQYPSERRHRMAEVLARQNAHFGASAKTLENINRLRSGACAVVTGQQVGLFGGPVFSIYKALTAVKLAQEAEKLSVDCVPVFWLATEDHDLAEVDHLRVPGGDALQTITTGVRGTPDAPVGNVVFGDEIVGAVARVQELLGESESTKLLSQCYCPGENFGSGFARLFARIFADFGVILLDGSDPELDQIASPLYASAISRSSEIVQGVIARGSQLESAGYHQQVRVTDSSTLLFLIRDGVRTPVQVASTGEFSVGEEKFSSQQLAALVSSSPQSFSPNVLLRPVVQDYLLPTLAYVGGAAEIAYFAQAAVVYEKLLRRVTPVLPRFSATIVEPKAQALLEKNHLTATEIFHGPEALRELIGARRLPPDLQSSFDRATAAVENSMKSVQDAIAQLDKTLVESADNAKSKMIYQITNLRARASRAELRHSEVIGRHSEVLSNALYPDKTLQEREFAGIYFLAKYGRELMNGLLEQVKPDCLNHQMIAL